MFPDIHHKQFMCTWYIQWHRSEFISWKKKLCQRRSFSSDLKGDEVTYSKKFHAFNSHPGKILYATVLSLGRIPCSRYRDGSGWCTQPGGKKQRLHAWPQFLHFQRALSKVTWPLQCPSAFPPSRSNLLSMPHLMPEITLSPNCLPAARLAVLVFNKLLFCRQFWRIR